MCGLVSIIPRKPFGFNSNELDLFEQMLIIDTFRGKDSTGVMTTFKDGGVRVIKTATQPYLMFETKQWHDFRAKTISTGRYVAGHNRAATRGDVSNDNAHPFVEDHIVLMHNGTIHNHTTLTKEKVDVDSHAICHALTQDTPQLVLPKIMGAWALIWYDTEQERLFATRNEERPLSIITTDDFYFLASEAWMAAMPAQRKNKTIISIQSIEPFDLLSFDMQGNLKVEKLPKSRPVSDTSHRYGHWMTGQHQQDKWKRDVESWEDDVAETNIHGSVTPNSTTTSEPEKPKLVETKEVDDRVNFPKGSDSERTPDEIESLRTALALRAQGKSSEQGEGSSNVCALTRPAVPASTSLRPDKTLTTMMKPDSSTNSQGVKVGTVEAELERIQAQQRNIISDNAQFVKGSEVLIKIWEINTLVNGRKKWVGKVMSPGKEMVDAQGFLPDDVLPSEWPHWMSTITRATVAWTTVSSGGPTVWTRDSRRCTYVDIHGADIPAPYWDYAVNRCTCSKCNSVVESWERAFTHVKMKGVHGKAGFTQPVNELNVICADCLLKVLPDGEIYDKFTSDYFKLKNAIYTARQQRAGRKGIEAAFKEAAADCAAPVQDRESVSTEPVGKNGSVIVIPGPSTIQ